MVTQNISGSTDVAVESQKKYGRTVASKLDMSRARFPKESDRQYLIRIISMILDTEFHKGYNAGLAFGIAALKNRH